MERAMSEVTIPIPLSSGMTRRLWPVPGGGPRCSDGRRYVLGLDAIGGVLDVVDAKAAAFEHWLEEPCVGGVLVTDVFFDVGANPLALGCVVRQRGVPLLDLVCCLRRWERV